MGRIGAFSAFSVGSLQLTYCRLDTAEGNRDAMEEFWAKSTKENMKWVFVCEYSVLAYNNPSVRSLFAPRKYVVFIINGD